MSPVTYSIASLFKRVFVICFAIVWFGQSVSRLQWIGIALTIVGLWMYNSTKIKKEVATNEAVVRKHERESSFSLPTTNHRSDDLVELNLNTSSEIHHQSNGLNHLHLHSSNTNMNTNTNHSHSPIRHQVFSQLQSHGPPPSSSIHPMFSQSPTSTSHPSGLGSGFRDFSTSSSSSSLPPRKVSSNNGPAASSIQPSGIQSYVKDPRGSLPSPPESGRSSAEDKL